MRPHPATIATIAHRCISLLQRRSQCAPPLVGGTRPVLHTRSVIRGAALLPRIPALRTAARPRTPRNVVNTSRGPSTDAGSYCIRPHAVIVPPPLATRGMPLPPPARAAFRILMLDVQRCCARLSLDLGRCAFALCNTAGLREHAAKLDGPSGFALASVRSSVPAVPRPVIVR
ncbi:hypothetical protein FKP32DRAFT_1591450 [Trametes sanguinea]|nr:hypothetical protein FKP32DRAFT_1591450 [Trametes sanguinea]